MEASVPSGAGTSRFTDDAAPCSPQMSGAIQFRPTNSNVIQEYGSEGIESFPNGLRDRSDRTDVHAWLVEQKWLIDRLSWKFSDAFLPPPLPADFVLGTLRRGRRCGVLIKISDRLMFSLGYD